jgi:hypothetical protein
MFRDRFKVQQVRHRQVVQRDAHHHSGHAHQQRDQPPAALEHCESLVLLIASHQHRHLVARHRPEPGVLERQVRRQRRQDHPYAEQRLSPVMKQHRYLHELNDRRRGLADERRNEAHNETTLGLAIHEPRPA